jgi:hypothetical protein
MVELRIPGDKVLLLEEGKLDSASWLAFLSGRRCPDRRGTSVTVLTG